MATKQDSGTSPLWGLNVSTVAASARGYHAGSEDFWNFEEAWAGEQLPAGTLQSCVSKAANQSPGGRYWMELLSLGYLPSRGPEVPFNEVGTKNAIREWSECMRASGISASSPKESFLEFAAQEEVTDREIETAVQEIRCKYSVRLFERLVAEQDAYDRRYIESNQKQITSLQSDLSRFAEARR
ncbi:hypothetical protein ACTQ49_09245 [Luteococcus sp. Sow4_B9]|uniref:hypothetical protein n=1 Tax=Luteococcus sp. Sow4_B9 TaxID=3438792 RepID=UPI003F9D88F7